MTRRSIGKAFSPTRWTIPLVALLLMTSVASARASEVGIGVDASAYAVLYEGAGGHNLQITNVEIPGRVGVGGTGKVQDNGPSTISGRVDFSASNTNQFSDNNGANQGPTSVNYNVADLTDALNAVNSLSSALGADAGTNLSFLRRRL
jgi:hypothetical protein